jgi:hypothetical protein
MFSGWELPGRVFINMALHHLRTAGHGRRRLLTADQRLHRKEGNQQKKYESQNFHTSNINILRGRTPE